MTQTEQLVGALKQTLRAKRLTYAQVAKALGTSEVTVKRLFSKGKFTLERLEAVCDIAGIRVADLARMADDKPEPITQLTPEQEKDLLADPKLLLVALLTLNGWTAEEIVEHYEVDEHEVVQRLARLDRLGMIELLPGNRIRRLVARHFSWRPGGPVAKYVEGELKTDFLSGGFVKPHGHVRFIGAQVSYASLRRLHQAIDKITTEIDEAIDADRELELSDKVGIGALFAIRPWEVPTLRALRRDRQQD